MRWGVGSAIDATRPQEGASEIPHLQVGRVEADPVARDLLLHGVDDAHLHRAEGSDHGRVRVRVAAGVDRHQHAVAVAVRDAPGAEDEREARRHGAVAAELAERGIAIALIELQHALHERRDAGAVRSAEIQLHVTNPDQGVPDDPVGMVRVRALGQQHLRVDVRERVGRDGRAQVAVRHLAELQDLLPERPVRCGLQIVAAALHQRAAHGGVGDGVRKHAAHHAVADAATFARRDELVRAAAFPAARVEPEADLLQSLLGGRAPPGRGAPHLVDGPTRDVLDVELRAADQRLRGRVRQLRVVPGLAQGEHAPGRVADARISEARDTLSLGQLEDPLAGERLPRRAHRLCDGRTDQGHLCHLLCVPIHALSFTMCARFLH